MCSILNCLQEALREGYCCCLSGEMENKKLSAIRAAFTSSKFPKTLLIPLVSSGGIQELLRCLCLMAVT